MDGKERILILKRCWVCGEAFMASKGTARCCSRPECRVLIAESHAIMMLQFLLHQMRWSGGEGFRTWEQWLQEAVEQLAVSSDPLAEVLIEIIEETAV